MNEADSATHNPASKLDDLIDGLEEHGDKPMVLAWTANGHECHSYRDIGGLVQDLARGLYRRINPGEAVALLGVDSPRWIAVALAVIRAGGAVMPLDVQMADDTLAHVLRDSSASWVFTTKGHQERVQAGAPDARIVLLDAAEGDGNGWQALAENEGELPDNGADATAALFYTSGTTGPPKGVPLTHANLAFQLDTVARSGITRDTDRVLLPLPLHHVYPFVIGMLALVHLGLSLVLPYALTGPQLMRTIHDGKVSVIIGVPRLYAALFHGIEGKAVRGGPIAAALFRLLLRLSCFARQRFGLYLGKVLFYPLHRKFGKRLRVLACGGAELDSELAWNLEALGWKVAVGYGLTETSPLLTIDPPGRIRPGTVGCPVQGVELRIDREAAAQAGVQQDRGGKEGEILARGSSVFAGYHNLPEKSREVLDDDGWFRTGDLGWVDEAGYLHITGRVSTLIVTAGGENIQPDALEERFAAHQAIGEIGILQHENKLVALIVPDKEIVDDARSRIQQALGEVGRQLPSYQQLVDFAITRKPLPRTRLGKIRRHKLSERYDEARRSGDAPAELAPLDPQEMSAEDRALLEYPAARLAWEWLAERYPKQGLSPDSGMELGLGIDSLEWLNLTLELGQRTGIELDDEAIGRIDTVRDLLRELIDATEKETGGADPIREPERVLEAKDRRWLRPRILPLRATAGGLYALDRVLMRMVYRLQVHGRQHLPEQGPIVVIANHASYLDPFAVAAALPPQRMQNLFWGGWTGVAFTNPLTRMMSFIARIIPIEPRRGVRTSLALSASVLAHGQGLIWFPEGQRSEDGKLQPFRPGLGMLLERFPVTVVPMAIHGTYEAMPLGRRWPGRGRISVRIGEPLDPRQLAEQGDGEDVPARIVAALHERMQALLQEK